MKSNFEKNIVNFITLSGGLAILDTRSYNPIQKEDIKNLAEKNGSIFMYLKFTEFKNALENTIYDILIPEIPKEVALLLANTEELLEESIFNIQEGYQVEIDYQLIKD